MFKKAQLVLIPVLFLTLVTFLPSCQSTISPITPALTPTPTPEPTPLPPPLVSIANVLQGAVQGHIAYNSPAAMRLEETVDVQLLLSPVISAEELKKLIVSHSLVLSADLEVTPLMKAELKPADPQAFFIQDLHDGAVQVIMDDVPTEWRWSLHAQKPGDQVLTLTIYRQVEYNGEFYWSMVQSYQNKIHISVSAAQRLKFFDWKWLAGIILTAVLVPAFWREIDLRKKKKMKKNGSKRHKR
jgi:hypothetical protein